jgi:Fe2+ transport system protein FeoA
MKKVISLNHVPKGGRVLIVEVPEGRGRTQLVRLGVLKGEFVKCIEHLPGGTVVIEKNRREIALGASLARSILVSPVAPAHAHVKP